MIVWELVKKNEPLVATERALGELQEGWARIKIAGCGLCHTDLGYIYTEVKTNKEFPLVLGHEISGTVVDGELKGQQVIIPSVIPCGECAPCKEGKPRICLNQMMPGNDIHGGFAEFIDVPAHRLVALPKVVDETTLAKMSVIADAVTTPLQSIKNMGLKKGDVAIFIGCGGVGGFGALIALAYGAHVIALDIDQKKLDKLSKAGVKHTYNVKDSDVRTTKKAIKEICEENGYRSFAYKIFETSGSTPGQELGFALINFGAKLATIGFTMDKLNVRLSNLMAYDAQIMGNWGSSPDVYPEAIQLYLDGKLNLDDFTELHPLANINDIIDKAHHGALDSRAVLVP